MNSSLKMYAALEGKKLDHFPVVAPYLSLFLRDHWEDITKKPSWKYHQWMLSEPSTHCQEYLNLHQQLAFDWVNPNWASTHEARRRLKVIRKEGDTYIYHQGKDTYTKQPENLHHLTAPPNEKSRVHDQQDIDEQVRILKAHEIDERGELDYIRGAVKLLGDSHFIATNISAPFYQCSEYVGLSRLFTLLYEDRELIEYLSNRLLEGIIERIRALANTGIDGIYVQNAMTTSDMISVEFFEIFVMPYLEEIIKEAERHNLKTVLYFFGGVADRIEQIVSLGADAINFEPSMKGYVNDIADIAQRIGDDTCLFGNINPYTVIELADEETLAEKIREQISVGRNLCQGGFVTSTGTSPITPGTSLARVKKYIEIAAGS